MTHRQHHWIESVRSPSGEECFICERPRPTDDELDDPGKPEYQSLSDPFKTEDASIGWLLIVSVLAALLFIACLSLILWMWLR